VRHVYDRLDTFDEPLRWVGWAKFLVNAIRYSTKVVIKVGERNLFELQSAFGIASGTYNLSTLPKKLRGIVFTLNRLTEVIDNVCRVTTRDLNGRHPRTLGLLSSSLSRLPPLLLGKLLPGFAYGSVKLVQVDARFLLEFVPHATIVGL
jgi:hypothetical protein